jgi:hypothetical protein
MTRIAPVSGVPTTLGIGAFSGIAVGGPAAGTLFAGGHAAVQGFCPVCGVVAPCYRARRAGSAVTAW